MFMGTMTNRFGFDLHPKDVRWAAAERVSENVIAAVLLLHERSIDEIVPELTPAELDQTIVLVGRSPRLYPRGTLEALEQRRSMFAPTLPEESRAAAKEQTMAMISYREVRAPTTGSGTTEPAGQRLDGLDSLCPPETYGAPTDHGRDAQYR
jgi:hypothetical protein